MATKHRIQGPHGAITCFVVPGPGMDERTFEARLNSGEFTLVHDVDGDKPDAPKPYASKADWVTYAVAGGMSREDAEGMTKQELVDKLS